MLSVLELRDFVLAHDVRLELGTGLHAFTGETGAGKSILVDALSLLAGGRADTGQVREGAPRALVQAEFAAPAAAAGVSAAAAAAAGASAGPASAARTLVAGGRNHARLDGELVTVAELADAVGRIVTVFAQHAQQALLSAAAQRDAVDRLLDEDGREALTRYREAWARRQQLLADVERLRDAARDRARRADLLTYQIGEIDEVAPTSGEEDDLAAEAARLRHSERIAEGAAGALAALDDEGGASESLATALHDLREAARFDAALATLSDDLATALQGARAVATELQGFLDGFDADPRRLDQVQARLAALQKTFRKYGTSSEEVLAFREACAAELADLDRTGEAIDDLEAELATIDAQLTPLATRLGHARREAGDRLTREATPLLARLALQDARLKVALEAGEPGPHGHERVRLMFGANVGERLAPLAQAASGGELSRVMLALWLVTGSDRPTLVFDEVDAGVGGRAARAVGELLAELGRRHQVLIVTHLPQVAAFAERQFSVGKRTEGGRTTTTVQALDDPGRERELARMLSGEESEAALNAARELLSQARAVPGS